MLGALCSRVQRAMTQDADIGPSACEHLIASTTKLLRDLSKPLAGEEQFWGLYARFFQTKGDDEEVCEKDGAAKFI